MNTTETVINNDFEFSSLYIIVESPSRFLAWFFWIVRLNHALQATS